MALNRHENWRGRLNGQIVDTQCPLFVPKLSAPQTFCAAVGNTALSSFIGLNLKFLWDKICLQDAPSGGTSKGNDFFCCALKICSGQFGRSVGYGMGAVGGISTISLQYLTEASPASRPLLQMEGALLFAEETFWTQAFVSSWCYMHFKPLTEAWTLLKASSTTLSSFKSVRFSTYNPGMGNVMHRGQMWPSSLLCLLTGTIPRPFSRGHIPHWAFFATSLSPFASVYPWTLILLLACLDGEWRGMFE